MCQQRKPSRRAILGALLSAPVTILIAPASSAMSPIDPVSGRLPVLTGRPAAPWLAPVPDAKPSLLVASPGADQDSRSAERPNFDHAVGGDGAWVVAGSYAGYDIGACVAAARAAANGRIPAVSLVSLLGVVLRADAAAMLSELNAAFAARFGRDLRCAQGYRDLAGQFAMKAEWTAKGQPGNAATPGTSNHGLGLAVDLAGPESQAGTAPHEWLVATAPLFGWLWPCNMRPGGAGPHEPWHFEFQGPGLGILGGGCGTGSSQKS